MLHFKHEFNGLESTSIKPLDFRKRVRWGKFVELCLMRKKMPALDLPARDAR
jgi:hypothetical protein